MGGRGINGGPTRVELNTVFRRGKSEIPLSRMDIEESRRESEERREVTEAVREAAACEVDIFVLCCKEKGNVVGARLLGTMFCLVLMCQGWWHVISSMKVKSDFWRPIFFTSHSLYINPCNCKKTDLIL